MKNKRRPVAQIAFACRPAESGTAAGEIVRNMKISEATFCRWKQKYEGLGVAEGRRPKQGEEDNRKLSNRWRTVESEPAPSTPTPVGHLVVLCVHLLAKVV
jgi:putative transposase